MRQKRDSEIPIILAGNKCDGETEQISELDSQELVIALFAGSEKVAAGDG